MLYISDKNETLKELKDKEGFEGSFSDYLRKFNSLNPHLGLKNDSLQLPSYMPMYLVTQPPSISDQAEVMRELCAFSIEKRMTLKKMQDNHYDFLSQVTMSEIMEELQTYSTNFRNSLDQPLISTPWDSFNHSLTNSSLVDMLSQGAIFGSGFIQGSRRFRGLEKLYDTMMSRDALNLRFHMLQGQRSAKAATVRKDLEKQIKELTREIKEQLPKKMNDTMSKYLNRRFTPDQIRKMRIDSYSKKIARKGSFATTQLDVLNKTGLNRLSKLIDQLKVLGDKAGRFSTFLGIGAVAFDTFQAYRNHKDVARTLFSGAAGFGAGALVGSAFGSASTLGALTIGTLAGDTALSTTVLLCCPVVGWVVATVVGIAVTGYVAYKASEAVEDLWDTYSKSVTDAVSSFADHLYDDIKSAWSSGSRWVLDFYGAN